MTDELTPAQRAHQFLPKGTDRVRRRAQQAQAKVQDVAEAAGLVSPSTPEKDAVIAERAAKLAAEKAANALPGQSVKRARRVAAQEQHAKQAEQEAAQVTQRAASALDNFKPGEQIDHLSLRRYMRQNARSTRADNRGAAQAAAHAVFDTLNGRAPVKGSKFRKIARAAAAAAKQG